jgi:hypothetical protein
MKEGYGQVEGESLYLRRTTEDPRLGATARGGINSLNGRPLGDTLLGSTIEALGMIEQRVAEVNGRLRDKGNDLFGVEPDAPQIQRESGPELGVEKTMTWEIAIRLASIDALLCRLEGSAGRLVNRL